jgi:hypothetical protein
MQTSITSHPTKRRLFLSLLLTLAPLMAVTVTALSTGPRMVSADPYCKGLNPPPICGKDHEPTPTPTPKPKKLTPTPPYSLRFDAMGLGHDPQVAVGLQYIAAIEAHSVYFFTKDGQPLLTANKQSVAISSFDLFRRFLAAKSPDGSPNPEYINQYLQLPPALAKQLPCDLTKDNFPSDSSTSCVNEVYDLRVAFDAKRDRFVFVGLARNQIFKTIMKGGQKVPNPLIDLRREYTFIAVTKTEDPRHLGTGQMDPRADFPEYVWADGSDWDRIAVTDKYLVITYNGGPWSNGPTSHGNGDVHVFSMDDLAKGSPTPTHWVYSLKELGVKGGIAPVIQHGSSGGYTFLVTPTSQGLRISAFGPPGAPGVRPPLLTTSLPLGNPPGMIRGNVVYRHGKIAVAFDLPVGNMLGQPFSGKIRVIRFPISVQQQPGGPALVASTDPAAGFLDYSFGVNGPGDKPSDVLYYEMPALEVTKNDDIIISYERRSTAVTVLNPEVRYSVLYHNESTTRPSAVLHKGEAMTDDPYAYGLDMSMDALDPSDDQTIWMVGAYATAGGGYEMVVGAVKP